jgi:hypothetical protein
MSTNLRSLVFSLLALLVIAVPQITLAQFSIDASRADATSFGVSTSTPSDILKNVINYALAIVGFLGILGFVISGIMYLVSAGDEDLAKRGKTYMVYSIIGVIIALVGYVVMAAISSLLGAGGSTGGL